MFQKYLQMPKFPLFINETLKIQGSDGKHFVSNNAI